MADFPSGTVTFLFTDIESSARRWQQDSAAMSQAITRHLTLLREAVVTHGGVLFKVVGDATQSAFLTAPAALAAALTAQCALQAESWAEEIGGLPVRMALHTGEAQPDPQGDYLAPSLNRLARLLAVGHGGQILLSQVTADLVRSQLPPDVGLRDLGVHALRDFAEPEAIVQAVHPALPAAFPPLATLAWRRSSLPTPATPFLGRSAEVAQVVALLQSPQVRLVTLTGSGGVGKTRLAIEAASRLVDSFPDGVVFVDLAPVTDPALVLSTIATALGLKEQGARPLLDILFHALATERVLLVLDNCEHLLAAAPDVAKLIAGVSYLSILATSRARLELSAEREFALMPMAVPERGQVTDVPQLAALDSIRLFVARAQAFKSDFVLTAENAPAIAAICSRLDGLPLAIELAAARTKLLPPTALLQRLEHRLPVLTGGPKDLPVRQRTLRDTIDWSYDLLSLEEQILFRRLAVFAGSWTFEAADVVANADGELDVFAGMSSLLDKSLVQANESGPAPRYRMLETIREFALEHLAASNEFDRLRRDHAAYYAALVGAVLPGWGREPRVWLDQIDQERDNVRAVLAWAERAQTREDAELGLRLAAHLAWFWWVRGPVGEGRSWLERLLAKSPDTAPELRGAALQGAGWLAYLQSDYATATPLLEASLAASRAAGDEARAATTLIGLGFAAVDNGEHERAMPPMEEALAVARGLDDKLLLATALNNLATATEGVGDIVRTSKLADEALTIAKGLSNAWLTAFALNNLGGAAIGSGAYEKAVTLFRESLTVAHEHEITRYVADALVGLAGVAAAQHRLEEAAQLIGAADALCATVGSPVYPHHDRYRRIMLNVTAELGEEAFSAAREAGAAEPLLVVRTAAGSG